MFESSLLSELTGWMTTLQHRGDDAGASTDTDRIDVIRRCEELKTVLAAVQAETTAALAVSQRQEQAERGVPAGRLGAGTASQVGLARRESPNRGARFLGLGLGLVLVHEMPCTLAAMRVGVLSEWRATLIARETACLSRDDRLTVDRLLGSDLTRLARLGDRELIAEARRLAYQLDPESFVARARKAETERTVTIRPAPDTMAYVTALLPVKQAVAVHAALEVAASSARAAGDPRSRGQVRADTLFERVTGLASAVDVPVGVSIVITDRALLQGDAEPAHLDGYGVVPADWARDLVLDAAQAGGDPTSERQRTWYRRVYTAPGTGELVAMDSRASYFPDGLRRLIGVRDGGCCRTPWCDAPLRHVDHVKRRADGGETSAATGQGLCEACNYAKEALGWTARPRPGPRHTVEVTTPTGHVYRSTSPPLPGTPIPTLHTRPSNSRLEAYFSTLLLVA